MFTRSRTFIVSAAACASLFGSASFAALPAHRLVTTFAPTEQEIFPDGVEYGPSPARFGQGVAIRDTYALAGMPESRGSHGAVAAYQRNAANVWQRKQTLVPKDAATQLGFGASIAFRSNIAVIGARNAAYVFRRDNDVWKQIAKLQAPASDGATDFGHAVQYQEGVVVVGAPSATAAGATYVFRINTGTGAVISRQRLVPFDGAAGDGFGTSVSMTHDTIVVGAPGTFTSDGAAYVFGLTNGSFRQWQKLISMDAARGDRFGAAVAIDRAMIIVGAPQSDPIGDYFGDPVSYYAGGGAYVFVPKNSRYIEQQKLRPRTDQSDWYIQFGAQVAMFDTYIVVSASTPDTLATSYSPPGLGFSYIRKGNTLTARGIAHISVESVSISIANNWLLMGSPYESRCGFGGCIGEARLFDLNRFE